MKFEIEINGKNYSFTKWLSIIVVLLALFFIAIDVYNKNWDAMFVDILFLIAVIQSNKITDLEDQVEKLKGE